MKKIDLSWHILAFITLAGAILRFKGLTFQSLWLDELHSAKFTLSKSLPQILNYFKSQDVHPPFYYLMLRIWEYVFGIGEASLRSLSAVLGILGVVAIYFLGKELFSKRVGLFAAALTAVNPFHIFYSQEAKSYSLIFLLSILSFLFLVKTVKKPTYKNALFYAFTCSVLLYSHYFGLFLVASQVAYVMIELFFRKDRLNFLKKTGLSFGMIFVLYIPWLPAFFRLTKIETYWAGKPAPDFFVHYFKLFLGHEAILVLLFSVFLFLYLIKSDGSQNFIRHKILLFSWVFITLLLPYFRSFHHPSALLYRYAIVILPAILLVAARAIESFKEVEVRYFFLSFVLVMFVINIFFTNGNFYKTLNKEQWREIAEFVITHDPDKEYPIHANRYFDYYFNRLFGHQVEIKPHINDPGQAQTIYDQIREDRLHGIWILEPHPYQDKNVYEFFEERLVKVFAFQGYLSRGGLFVSVNSMLQQKKELNIVGLPSKEGFYDDEVWTKGEAAIKDLDYEIKPDDRFIVLKTYGYRPPRLREAAVLKLYLRINETEIPLNKTDGLNYFFEIPGTLNKIQTIQIQSSTFIPKEENVNPDVRRLGLDIRAIEIR